MLEGVMIGRMAMNDPCELATVDSAIYGVTSHQLRPSSVDI